MIYTCLFEVQKPDGTKSLYAAHSDRGLEVFKDGFWVDSNFKLPEVAAHSAIWIPPARICYVVKSEYTVAPQPEKE